jgi:hypothetical protein
MNSKSIQGYPYILPLFLGWVLIDCSIPSIRNIGKDASLMPIPPSCSDLVDLDQGAGATVVILIIARYNKETP